MCLKCRVIGEKCTASQKQLESEVRFDEQKHADFLREATKEEGMRFKRMQNVPDSLEKPGEIISGIADLEILTAELVDVLAVLENRLAPVLPQAPALTEPCEDSSRNTFTPLGARLAGLAERCTRSIRLVKDILKNLEV